MLKIRILTFIALFQIVLGAGILAGGFLSSWDARFYFALFQSENSGGYASMEYKGENDAGIISVLPYKKEQLPSIPVISVDKKSSTESFSTYPAQPMDWAVLFFRLRNMGVDHIGVLSPMVWEEAPNEIVSEALSHELELFKSARIGKKLGLSARESILPEQLSELVLGKDQYVGETKNIPSANKFYGEPPQLAKTTSIVPSVIENDEAFLASSSTANQSMPLFIRWNQSIVPTLPLLVTLDSMNLDLKDIYVHFGENLRLGENINIPIDETGRIYLSSEPGIEMIDLSSILSEDSPRAVESANRKEIARKILSSSPCVLVAEAPMGAESADASAFIAARTIKNLCSSIKPCPIIELNPVSVWIQWVLLIDILVIGFWAFQFKGWIRWALLSFCIGIIPIIASYKWISCTEWLPLTPCIASIAVLFLVKRFIPLIRKDNEESEEENENTPPAHTSSLHSIPAPEHDFDEPEEVPIPKQKGKK